MSDRMADTTTETLKRTPLYDVHVECGAKLVPFAGYDMPVQFPMGVMEEHNWTRQHAGLFDVSHMGPCFLTLEDGIVGDRFVFQSEVLFDVGSADLGAAGKEQMAALAKTLLELIPRIPQGIDWVLRVDGHTDKTPIHNLRFASNWELSSARAISVVKYLITLGIPPARLVAAGFADNFPIDPGNDEIALRRNRRIELKLTQR